MTNPAPTSHRQGAHRLSTLTLDQEVYARIKLLAEEASKVTGLRVPLCRVIDQCILHGLDGARDHYGVPQPVQAKKAVKKASKKSAK